MPRVAAVSRLRGWPVWTAALWVAVEVWRSSYPFGGMPWGRLAYATADTPFSSALPYVGATGVSLLVALLGTTLAWVVLRCAGLAPCGRRERARARGRGPAAGARAVHRDDRTAS